MKGILVFCCVIQSMVFAQTSVTISGDTSLCPGQSSVLSVSDEYVAYQWFIKTISIPTLPIPQYAPINGAVYDTISINHFDHSAKIIQVRMVDINGDTLYSDEKEIIGYAFSNPYLVGFYNDWQNTNPDTGEVFICPGDTVGLMLMPEYLLNDVQWFRNGQLIGNDTTHLVTQDGFYEVGGTPGFCPNHYWTTLQVSWCVLSVEEDEYEEIRIVNPVSEPYLIFTNTNYSGNFEISDELGREVLSGKFQDGKIDVSGLKSGVYFIRISDRYKMKFIK